MTATRRRVLIMVVIVVHGFAVESLQAQNPTRDLSNYVDSNTTFTVAITIDASPGTNVVGAEDAPPADWSVTSVSDSGTWDAQSLSVKWGPFFDPGIPSTVSYDVTPTGIGAISCFSGTVSFDGDDEPIEGDDCVGDLAPATSTWGLGVMMLILMVTATLILRRRLFIGSRSIGHSG